MKNEMTIETIYLDMDGVLCSFDGRYRELFGMAPTDARARKEFRHHWVEFITKANFATLDYHPGAEKLLAYIASIADKVHVEMLTSSGGKDYYSEVAQQKIQWLCERGIPYKANVVSGRRYKAEYATPTAVMIDDTEDVITSFRAAGGIAIHHTAADLTIETLKGLM